MAAKAVDLRKRLDQLAELLADGSLTPAAVRRSSEKLRTSLAAVEAERAQHAAQPGVSALAAAKDVSKAWEQLTLLGRRAVIDALLTATILPVSKGIRFAPEQVQIEWKDTL